MPADALAAAAAIVMVAATLQTAVGFGLGLVAVPLLVGAGRSLPEAVALALGAGFVQTSYGTYTLRAHVRWRRAFLLALTQWLCLPLGVLIMMAVADAGPARVKQAVGALLVALVSARLLAQPVPRERVALGWGVAAGASSGLLSGISGMGGPPLVFYALAHDWDKDRFRAFLWPQFLLASPMLMALIAHRTGAQVLVFFVVGLAFAPLVWLGARIGMSLTARWDHASVNRAAVLMLYAIGFINLFAPLW